jgi:hypothetical protein
MQTPVAAAPSPNPATIQNAGNTYLRMTVKEDDIGLRDNRWQCEPLERYL